MKILVLNPNISEEITHNLMREANKLCNVDCVINTTHVERGVEYIENETEALMASVSVIEYVSVNHSKYDAIIVAAFGDPGVSFLKSCLDIPIIGLTEASMYTAVMLGNTIGIYTISASFIPWYRKIIGALGITNKVTFIKSLDLNMFDKDRSAVVADAAKAIKKAQAALGSSECVDVLVLAGAPFSGVACELDDLAVPVVDGISCAIKMCQSLFEMNKSRHKNMSGKIYSKKTYGIPKTVIDLLSY